MFRKTTNLAKLPDAKRLLKTIVLPHDANSTACVNRLDSAKVIYDQSAYPNSKPHDEKAFSLWRALTKAALVDVGASREGVTVSGKPWPGKEKFMSFLPGDQAGLSPEERCLARKKVITSKALAYQQGGYPARNIVQRFTHPIPVTILTQPGMQFEHPKLDYNEVIVDPVNHPEEYEALRQTIEVNQSANKETDAKFLRSKFFRYIIRDPKTGQFGTSFFDKHALILKTAAYYSQLVDSFHLFFIACQESAGQTAKDLYVKMPLMGMGYFAKIDEQFNISSQLIGVYLRALFTVLRSGHYQSISRIEIPVFGEGMIEQVQYLVNEVFDIENLGCDIVITPNTDVLSIGHINTDQHHIMVLNPGDGNSVPGNEPGYRSVESAIGDNTDIRYIQNCHLNPNLLKHSHWKPVQIPSHTDAHADPNRTPRKS